MSTKTLSVISSAITVILLVILGVMIFFMEMIALNGYSGSEGGPALTTSAICLGIGAILSAILAGWLTRLFITRFSWHHILAMATSIFAGLVAGAGMGAVSFFVSILVAEMLR